MRLEFLPSLDVYLATYQYRVSHSTSRRSDAVVPLISAPIGSLVWHGEKTNRCMHIVRHALK